MSDNVPDTEVRLDTDLLDLRKRASQSSTEYPVFEYRIDYHGSPPGELRLTETFPPEVDADDVEFHPDFYGENWSCDGDEAVFEYILPDADVVETKFGLTVDDPDVVEAVLSPPTAVVENLETGERIAGFDPDDADLVSPSDDGMAPVEPDPVSDTVREIIMGSENPVEEEASPADVEDPIAAAPASDGGTPPSGAEADAEEAPGDDFQEAGSDVVADAVDAVTDESTDPPDDAPDVAADALGSETEDPVEGAVEDLAEDVSDADGGDDLDESADASTVDVESVGTALAAELRAGTIPDDDLTVLRDHLDVGPSESDAVRLEDLQSRFHDLAAYTDALEAFIDENGDADGVLADLQSGLSAVEEEVETLSAATERVERIEGRLDDNPEAGVLEERIDGVVADVDEVERTLHSRVGEIEDRLAELESTVTDVEEQTEVLLELQDVFGGSD